MKTKNLLITLGVAAVATATINVNAALLSPRATGNQIIHVAGVSNDPNYVALRQYANFVPPRAAGNQTTIAAGTNSDVNPATACAKTMAGTPKNIQKCVEQATMPGCNPVTVAPLK